MKKFLEIVLIILVIIGLFGGTYLGAYAIYVKVISLCVLMFLIFRINATLSSKKPEDKQDNLKL